MRLAHDFGELSGGDYSVRRFEGQALRLPHRPEWWPGRENLAAQVGPQLLKKESRLNCDLLT